MKFSPSFAWKFSIPEIFWYTEVFPNQIFRYSETKNFRRKNVIPPFSSIKLFETRNCLKNSRMPLRNFSVLWDKKNWLKFVICSLLSINFFSIPEIFFWKTEGFLYKAFQFDPVSQKISTKQWSFLPLLLENFRYQNFFETQKCSPTNFIGTKLFVSVLWDKKFWQNRDADPPLRKICRC